MRRPAVCLTTVKQPPDTPEFAATAPPSYLQGRRSNREQRHGTRPSLAPPHRRGLDAALASGRSFAADAPLHVKIDRLIEAKLEGDVAAPATDAEFLRRVFLDLAGMIPTSARGTRISR